VILGGTELTLLLKAPVLAGIPTLDTTALHVAAIVDRLRGRREAGGGKAGKRESGKAG
jgi:aspartate/glutamate racemase